MHQLDTCGRWISSTSQCCLKAPPFPVCQDVEHFKMNQLRFAAGTTAGSGLTYLTCAGKQEQFRWEMFLNGCFIHRLISLDTSKSNFGGCYLWTLTSGEWSQTCFWIENTYCSCFYFSVQCTLMKNIVSIVKMFSIEETYELILVFLNRHKSNKILRYNILDFLDPDPWVIHLKFWQRVSSYS